MVWTPSLTIFIGSLTAFYNITFMFLTLLSHKLQPSGTSSSLSKKQKFLNNLAHISCHQQQQKITAFELSSGLKDFN